MPGMTNPCIELPPYTFDVGTNPEEPPKPNHMRKWQATAFGRLDGRLWTIITAPTGSGKSTLIMVLICALLAREPKTKAVIAVPQIIIGDSFAEVDAEGRPGVRTMVDPSGRTHRFEVGHRLLGTSGNVERILAFLRADAGKTLASRVLVCTHATLVAAFKKILKLKPTQRRSLLADVALYIDEMHHAHAGQAEELSEEKADRKLGNQLGRLVSYWTDKKNDLGHLTLATATPLRADPSEAIIPPGREDDFAQPYEFDWADYVDSMRYLKRIRFRFIIGEPEDALRDLFAEGQQKTIIYLPHVSAPATKCRGGKAKTLSAFKAALGKVVATDGWTETLSFKAPSGKAKSLRIFDAVTVAGRKERFDAFRQARKAGTCPDVMFSLNLGREGFDWPAVARLVVIGERASIPDVLQTLGRLLRDVPGKEEIEFTMVLPGGGREDDGEQASAYLRKILSAALIPSFLCPHKGPSLPLHKSGEAINGLLIDLINGGGLSDDDDDLPESGRRGSRSSGGEQPPPFITPSDGDDGAKPARGRKRTGSGNGSDAEKAKRVMSLLSPRTRAMLDECGLAWNPEFVVYARGLVRVVAFKKCGKTLTQIRDESGKRAAYPSEDVVRAFSQGKTIEEYNAMRMQIGGPEASVFESFYKKTFGEIRDGRCSGQWPDEDTIRAFVHGKSAAEYDSKRREIRGPVSSNFRHIYKKSFRHIRDGRAIPEWPSEEVVREFIQGMKTVEYDAKRGAIGGPTAVSFPAIYMNTFKGIRDGRRNGAWANVEKARAFAQGKSCRQYDATCASVNAPSSASIKQAYGLTFTQLRDGDSSQRKAA